MLALHYDQAWRGCAMLYCCGGPLVDHGGRNIWVDARHVDVHVHVDCNMTYMHVAAEADSRAWISLAVSEFCFPSSMELLSYGVKITSYSM